MAPYQATSYDVMWHNYMPSLLTTAQGERDAH